MQLFFNAALSQDDSVISFNRDESSHIHKVLRKKIGDTLQITDGKGRLYTAKLIASTVSKCVACISSFSEYSKPGYKIHLAFAPPKSRDRLDWLVEKATEIGITELTPICSEHSERKLVKTERIHRIMQAALKQSQQYYLPKLQDMIPFDKFISGNLQGAKCIAYCGNRWEKKLLYEAISPQTDVWIVIGPEGGFTINEIEIAMQNKFTAVSLGNTRLRTETAAVLAVHTIGLRNRTSAIDPLTGRF